MSARVWMRHPDLPDDQLIQVDRLQVPHYGSAGWVETEAPAPKLRAKVPSAPDPAAATPDAADEAATPQTDAEPDSPKRRRSTSTEKETTP